MKKKLLALVFAGVCLGSQPAHSMDYLRRGWAATKYYAGAPVRGLDYYILEPLIQKMGLGESSWQEKMANKVFLTIAAAYGIRGAFDFVSIFNHVSKHYDKLAGLDIIKGEHSPWHENFVEKLLYALQMFSLHLSSYDILTGRRWWQKPTAI